MFIANLCVYKSRKHYNPGYIQKKLYGPFLWMGFNCLKTRAFSRGQFTFTTKFPEIPGTHFIDLGRMKG